jgi:hypothetical protein
MHLYSTMLQIENHPVAYRVSKEGGKFLLFTPLFPLDYPVDPPIFWVSKQDGVWKPIKLQDPTLVQQVIEDIRQHQVE